VTTSRDHVGIITEVHGTSVGGNWIWSTVEGGQGSGFLTTAFSRTIELGVGGRRFHGEGNFRRPIVKWVDLEALASSVSGS
jgi:hypothetical protein